MDKPEFVYVTYIATTVEKLWESLTSEAFTQKYWGGRRIQSNWQVGSSVRQVQDDRLENGQMESSSSESGSSEPGEPGSSEPDEPGSSEPSSSNGEGKVLASDPPYLLSYTFRASDFNENRPSRVVFELQPQGPLVKLTLTHDRLDTRSYMAIYQECPASLSSLKSLLEADTRVLVAVR